MRPWLESFLQNHPVFHINALESLLAQPRGQGEQVPTLRGLINHLRKKGYIEGIRQRVFRSLLCPESDRGLDPYVLVSQLEPRAVLSNRAALHWHLRLPAPEQVHFLSRQIAHPWTYESRSYLPVQDALPEVAIETFWRGPYRIQVTTAERTLVDLLNRPDLESDRLQSWRDLQGLPLSEEAILLDYLERLQNRTLNAKVAYFLDMLPWDHFMRRHCLNHFGGTKHPLPKATIPWDQQYAAPSWTWDDQASTRPEWSLRIPDALTQLEALSTKDPAEVGSRTLYEPGTLTPWFLKADLKENFGFEGYREGQEALVKKVLAGEDALGILPTGSGKSLTYLQPSLLLNGPTIVISPLIALIDDQILEARSLHLNAFALNQANRAKSLPLVRDRLRDGKLHLVFIPPESWPWLIRTLPRLRTLARQIVVDEAHVVVEWGQDFRKAYRNLGRIREHCPAPILALTATATVRTQGEIIRGLKLKGVRPARHSVRKDNLSLHVAMAHLPEGNRIPEFLQKMKQADREDLRDAIFQARFGQLKTYLAERGNQRGIIYCNRKRDADKLAEELQNTGLGRVEAYHGDQKSRERFERLIAFKEGHIQIMVATVAFGLGVNLRDIGFVAHFGMPSSLDAYTQAIGRAGREDFPADCVLIHVEGEEAFLHWLAGLPSGGKAPNARTVRRRREQVRAVVDWINTKECRHHSLDQYFGIHDGLACLTRCDVCLEGLQKPSYPARGKPEDPEMETWNSEWSMAMDVELEP